ncbi:MAG: hypothetical protein AAB701_00565 [Patescibacteria group bacterium]
MHRIYTLLILIAILLLAPQGAMALDSATYSIPQFNMNSFGNEIGSTNFEIRASSGPIVGVANSTNYSLDTGFPSVTGSVVSLTLNAPTVNLGLLVPGSPVTGTTTSTVATDSSAGYTLAIQKDRLMTHTNNTTTISDSSGTIAAPTAFSGGLGFTISSGTSVDPIWGGGANYAAIPTLTPTVYHELIQSISSPDATTITYQLNVPVTQEPGSYSTSVAIYAAALP